MLAVITTVQAVTPEIARAADCITVDMEVSPEKVDLLTDLAKRFNGSDRASLDGECITVRVVQKSSGEAASLLADDWPNPKANGPRPVVWSPASSAWGQVVNQRRADAGKKAIAPAGSPLQLTPLVIAMPKPMAEALGYPKTPLGYADILALARDPDGWARVRTSGVGPVPAREDQSELLDQRAERDDRPVLRGDRQDERTHTRGPRSTRGGRLSRAVSSRRSCTTATPRSRSSTTSYRADQRGTGLTYVSAVAVEEKSVIDYNQGNPDGILDPGEHPDRRGCRWSPSTPRRARSSRTARSSSSTRRGSTKQKQAAATFQRVSSSSPTTRSEVLKYGFRPGNPKVAIGAPIEAKSASIPTSRRRRSRCRRRRCSSASSTSGSRTASRPGC